MSRAVLTQFLQNFLNQAGAKLGLCCSRQMGNLPSRPQSDREGRLA